MRTAIIINDIDNDSLLRFTETKLFFDAKNQGIEFVDDCEIVNSLDEAMAIAATLGNVVILRTGDFLTTTFRQKYKNTQGIIHAVDNIIKFDPHTYVGFKKKCHYSQGTKQLYIIENLLKTCLRKRKLVYLDNTEPVGIIPKGNFNHLFGLASGWKTIQLAEQIGFDRLDTITVYDFNKTQLEHAKWAHSNSVLPRKCPNYSTVCGEYNPYIVNRQTWAQWNKFPVKFEQINLFDIPKFLDQSLIWVSNVFRYEPNIFDFGWKICKNARTLLCEQNKQSIII
jgi:hypothetical protein